MSGDRIGSSLARLDAESRALLELSLLRDVSDDELGAMLGIDAGGVRSRRNDVFDELGASSPLARAAVVRALHTDADEPAAASNGGGVAAPPAEHDPVAGWEPKSGWEPDPTWGIATADAPPTRAPTRHIPSLDAPFAASAPPTRRRRRSAVALPGDRSMRLALLAGLLAAVVVVIVLSSTGGGDSGGSPQRSASAAAPATSTQTTKGPGSLSPLVGSSGTGRARVVRSGKGGRQLSLSVRGLPAPQGAYELWLYDSVSDALTLRKVRRGSFDVQVALPRAAATYRYLDVSSEPDDGNENHSGASVLRVRLDRIPGF